MPRLPGREPDRQLFEAAEENPPALVNWAWRTAAAVPASRSGPGKLGQHTADFIQICGARPCQFPWASMRRSWRASDADPAE